MLLESKTVLKILKSMKMFQLHLVRHQRWIMIGVNFSVKMPNIF